MGNLAAEGRAPGDLGHRGSTPLSHAPMESVTECFLPMKGDGGWSGRGEQDPVGGWGPQGTPLPPPGHSPSGENLRPMMVLSLQPTMCFWPPWVDCSHCWPLAVPTSTQSSWGLGDRLIIWGVGGREEAGQVPAWPGAWSGAQGPTLGADLLPTSWLQGPDKQLHTSGPQSAHL